MGEIMKLLVQGDDFGFTKGVIYGIVDAIDNGILRNTGLFANSPYAPLAVSYMDERRDKVCFGIDFNLVSGPSLLNKSDIPHLIDDSGMFISSGKRIHDERFKTEEGRREMFPYEEVYKELRAQYDRFVELTGGHKPGYLAPHSLGHETYNEAMAQISKETGVPLAMELQKKYEFANLFFILMQEKTDKASQNKTFDASDQLNKNTTQAVIDHWDELMSHEYASIGQHPGYLDVELLQMSSLSLERIRDHQMMTSPVIKKMIEDSGVELITYYDLY